MSGHTGWAELGRRIADARDMAGLTVRAAAKQAGFSEGYWRQLEAGEVNVRGVMVEPGHSSEIIDAAASVVGLDSTPLLELIGREPLRRPARAASPRRNSRDLAARIRALLEEYEAQLDEEENRSSPEHDPPGAQRASTSASATRRTGHTGSPGTRRRRA